MNVTLFDMDFRIDAVAGYFFLLLCTGLITREYLRLNKGQENSWYFLLTAIALVFCCFSFNNVRAYPWALVMEGYIPTAVSMLFVLWLQSITLSNARISVPRLLTTLAFTFILLVVADDTGILAVGSTGLLALCYGLQEKRLSRVWPLLGVLLLGIVLYTWFKGPFAVYLFKTGMAGSFSEILEFYLTSPGVIIDAVLVPFGSSLVAKSSGTAGFLQGHTILVIYLLGIIVLSLHLFAWVIIFRCRLLSRTWLPALLMLLSYAYTLGILVYRVPAFSSDSLYSLRYVRAYQLGLWGSLFVVFWYGTQTLKSRRNTDWLRASLLIPVCGLIVLQLVLFVSTISSIDQRERQHLKDYQRIVFFYEAGDSEGLPCEGNKKVCMMPPRTRDRRIAILAKHELNVFSERLKTHFAK